MQHDRTFAQEDPRGFLQMYRDGTVFDEIQRSPDLMSHLPREVDRDSTHGRFVPTGSQNFSLSNSVSQSFSGRTAVIELLPLAYEELLRFENAPLTLWLAVCRGGYPRIANEGVAPTRWMSYYV